MASVQEKEIHVQMLEDADTDPNENYYKVTKKYNSGKDAFQGSNESDQLIRYQSHYGRKIQRRERGAQENAVPGTKFRQSSDLFHI
jgi:hypothetical protein